MSEDLFQLIALGLLVLLVVVLIVVAIQLARLRGALGGGAKSEPFGVTAGPPLDEDGSPAAVGPSSNGESEAVPETSPPSYGSTAVEEVPAEAAPEPVWEPGPAQVPEPEPEPEPEPMIGSEPATEARTEAAQPFERDGRWWFERDEELLVYDDRTGEWTPAESEGSDAATSIDVPLPASEPQAVTEPELEMEPDTQSQTESRPSWLLPESGPEPVTEPVSQEPEPVTQTEPEPVSQMDPDPTPAAVTPRPEDLIHPLDEPRPEDDLEEEVAATTAEPAVDEPAPQVASFWKCPSCGVVNGSTASSCRMCFTARP